MRYREVDTIDDAMEMTRWLSAQRVVACDTETTSLDVYDDGSFDTRFRVRLVQFGNTEEAWVVRAQDWRGLVSDVFRRFDGIWVMHNSRFDIPALATLGAEVPIDAVHDTMIALRLAEPTKSAKLKEAATRHIDERAAVAQKDLHEAIRKAKWTYETIPIDFPLFLRYAAMDAILTARLFEAPVVQMGLASPVYDLEMDVRAICSRMEANGMRIDRDLAERTVTGMRSESDEIQTRALEEFDLPLTSTAHLARWLMASDARDTIIKVTTGGAPSTDKETLARVIERYPGTDEARVAEWALRVRKLDKLASTYFANFIDRSDKTGMLHPSIETIAARTGRQSIREPALQTLPRGADIETQVVRRCVLGREPDHVVMSADAAQIELRIAANLSNDPGLIAAFADADTGLTDFFTESARTLYDDRNLLKNDPRRDTVKAMWYASLYGAGSERMAATAGVSLEAIKELRASVASKYPKFARLKDVCEREARDNNGWVTTPHGRRLNVDDARTYTATNYKIQGAACDLLKVMLVRLAQAGCEDLMMLPVHDEVVLSVPKADIAEVAQVVTESMCFDEFPVSILASTSVGATYAEAK